jgi:acyl carrier protein
MGDIRGPVEAADDRFSRGALEAIVLECVARLNEGRRPGDLLDVKPDAAIFGHGSRLDSLGLVTLLIEIEEQLAVRGRSVTLADARAMSQTRSPFRDVPALVGYLDNLLTPQS